MLEAADALFPATTCRHRESDSPRHGAPHWRRQAPFPSTPRPLATATHHVAVAHAGGSRCCPSPGIARNTSPRCGGPCWRQQAPFPSTPRPLATATHHVAVAHAGGSRCCPSPGIARNTSPRCGGPCWRQQAPFPSAPRFRRSQHLTTLRWPTLAAVGAALPPASLATAHHVAVAHAGGDGRLQHGRRFVAAMRVQVRLPLVVHHGLDRHRQSPPLACTRTTHAARGEEAS